MPYYFTCPKCKTKNHGHTSPPHPGLLRTGLSCRQCGLKDIVWLASADDARRMPATRGTVVIGVGESEIFYTDAAAPAGRLEDILPLMNHSSSLVAPFSQGARITGFTPSVTGISEGLCEGQCLHWVRRVLQGGRTEYLVPARPGPAADEAAVERQRRQHLVGSLSQVTDTDAIGRRAIDERVARIERVRTSHPKLYAERMGRLNEQIRTGGFYAYGWGALAHELDRIVTERYGASSRPYSNILATHAVKAGTRYAACELKTFVAGMLGDPGLVPDRAVLVSAKLKVGVGEAGGKIAGHAVAFHMAGTGVGHLFDPNLGIFHCKTKHHLQAALLTLMGPVWRTLGWKLLGSFGYTIFRAGSSPADKKGHEREVDYVSPSPKDTGIRNKAWGVI